MLRRIVSFICVAAVCSGLALGGCSSSKVGGSAPGQAAKQVDATGGSLAATDGSGVTIPPGALASSVNVTVQSDPGAPTLPSQWVAVGTPYLFGPEGRAFSQPVTVTLAIDLAKLPTNQTAQDVVILTSPATGTPSYSALPTTVVDATHVSARTTHFSVFAPAVGASCNNVALQQVTASFTCGSLPAPTGGTIVDGTYVQTSIIQTSSPCVLNSPSMLTVVVSGSSWHMALGTAKDGGLETGSAAATATTNGNSLSLAYSCAPVGLDIPDSGIQTFQYIATPIALQLETSDGLLGFTRESTDGGTGASLDAGGADGSLDGGAADAGGGNASFACVQPSNPAPTVQGTQSCGNPPTPAGGTIVDGTYYLTSGVEYLSDAGCSPMPSLQGQGTIVVRGGEISTVVIYSDGSGGWGIFANPSSGTSLDCICGTFSPCPDAGNGRSSGYSATGTSLTLFPGPDSVLTFTKQ